MLDYEYIQRSSESLTKENEDALHYFSSTPTQNILISSSTDNYVSDIAAKPDVTLLCDYCKCFLKANELPSHNAYHAALQLFKFKETPTNMDILVKRRELLIQRMHRLNPKESYMKFVKLIDEAFDILKRNIEHYYYGLWTSENRDIKLVQGLSFTPRNRVLISVGMCSIQNRQYKAEMEDSMRFIDCYGGNERFVYLGMFDGYNGKNASNMCREYMHDAILCDLSKFENDLMTIDKKCEESLINRLYSRLLPAVDFKNMNYSDTFRLAHSKMDYLLSRGRNEQSNVRWSGCSSLTAVIKTTDKIDELTIENDDLDENLILGQIHIANCGNVEALGVRAGDAFLLTQKHTLKSKREKERVGLTNVWIGENDLIAGIIETSRGLGNHGDKELKESVINQPYTWTYNIDQNLEAIIFGTEGLWNALTYETVVDLVTQCLPAHHLPAPSRLQTALRSVLEHYKTTPVTFMTQTHTYDRFSSQFPATSANTDDDDISDVTQCISDLISILEEQNSKCRDAGVQCSEEDIQQVIWDSLSSQSRLRLEVAQAISERLVSAALMAGSKTNISVICLLLPGAAI